MPRQSSARSAAVRAVVVALVTALSVGFAGCAAPAAQTGSTGSAAGQASPATSGYPSFAAGGGPSAAPSVALSPVAPGSSPGPSADPIGSAGAGASSIPPDVASAWRQVAPPIAVPAAYLDVGFAGDGDLIVLGTDDITDAKLHLWVARYTPAGTRRSKHAVDRRITAYAGDWIDVDPTDDSVLISEREAGTTTYIARRISSATGRTIASIDLHDEVKRIAVDATGRMFAITPFYSTVNNRRPCIIDRLGAGGGIAAGADHYLEPCETRGFTGGPAFFADPVAIEVGLDGRLLLIDSARENGLRRGDERAGLAVTVLTTAFEIVRQFHLPLEWRPGDPPYGVWEQSISVVGSGGGPLYVGEVIISEDGTHSTGYRVRAFDRDGDLTAIWGVGGDEAEPTWPIAPNVDSNGRLWVIDLDTSTRQYSIKVLEP